VGAEEAGSAQHHHAPLIEGVHGCAV
jgi:hypothetical protein